MSQPTVSNAPEGSLAGSPILPLLVLGFGAYLLWFGTRYWRGSGPAVWPSYPIKNVLQGKGVPKNQSAPAAIEQVTSYESGLASQISTTGGGGTTPGGGVTVPSGTAQNAAKILLGSFGWPATELAPLISLWTKESGWSATAYNPSGAYGIAQALGHAGPGDCAVGPRSDGSTTPGLNCAYGAQYGLTQADAQAANAGHWQPQLRWGLGYIKDRYGSPSAAWAHETAFNWY